MRSAASRTRAPSFVAVSFLAGGACQRLPLKSGDILVVRFDSIAVKSGLVDPKEIVRYLRRGVEVHAVANLHAKVYVFGNTAFVGSANVSSLSEHFLVEAMCESTDRSFVSACRKFVRSLRGDVVDAHFAKTLIPLFRPPRFVMPARRNASPVQSSLAVVVLQPVSFNATDERALAQSEETAVRRRPDETFRVEYFLWPGKLPEALRQGTNVLCCTHYSQRNIMVSAPARVLHVKRYRSAFGERALVYIAFRKYSRERSLKSVIRAIPEATFIKRIRSFRRVADRALAARLASLWPTAGVGRPTSS